MDLNRLYQLADENQKEAALDLIFQGIDRLLCAGRFDGCDDLLREVELTRLDATLIVGLLNATLSASAHVPGRPAFVERAAQQLRTQRGDEATARLIERHRRA